MGGGPHTLTHIYTLLYWPGRAYILQHSLLCRYLTFAAFQGRRPSRERASIRFVFTLIAPHICCIYIYSSSLYTILPRLALTRRLFMPRIKDAARRARRRFSKRASQRERRSATTDSASLTTEKNPHLHILRECARTDGIKSQKGATRRPNARPGKVRAEN
jgi:hypothetical protein